MESKVPVTPGVGRNSVQKPVRDDRKNNQFEFDRAELIKITTGKVPKTYRYLIDSSMLIDLKDPTGSEYKTYIAIRGDGDFFNFFDWSKYSLWEAVNAAMTLVDCVNCFDCERCIDCRNCVDVSGLVGSGAKPAN